MLKMGAQNITGLYVGETKIKKAYLGEALIFSAGMNPSRLPEGYTEVEYVEAVYPRRDCFVMDIIPDSSSGRIVGEFNMENPATTNDGYTFGGRSPIGTFYMQVSAGKVRYKLSGSSAVTKSVNIIGRKVEISVDWKNKSVVIDGNTYSASMSTSAMTAFYLFSYIYSAPYSGQGKIYSFKIYSDNILQGDYVPCADPNGSIGLYNLITGVFIPSRRSYFAAGPAV